MFGRRKRKERKAERAKRSGREAAPPAHLDEGPASPPPPVEPALGDRPVWDIDETLPDASQNDETDRAVEARPVVSLLRDGERLGFEPELHIPESDLD